MQHLQAKKLLQHKGHVVRRSSFLLWSTHCPCQLTLPNHQYLHKNCPWLNSYDSDPMTFTPFQSVESRRGAVASVPLWHEGPGVLAHRGRAEAEQLTPLAQRPQRVGRPRAAEGKRLEGAAPSSSHSRFFFNELAVEWFNNWWLFWPSIIVRFHKDVWFSSGKLFILIWQVTCQVIRKFSSLQFARAVRV